jgi:hypothetical protein
MGGKMIPNRSNPRWAEIVRHPEAYKTRVTSMGTKMMLASIGIRAERESVLECVEHAYNYFARNERALADDIAALFK